MHKPLRKLNRFLPPPKCWCTMTRLCLSLLRKMRLPMALAQLSHTPCLMALNAQLHLLPVPCLQVNVTMLSWRKRHCPWSLPLNVSTSTCMGESLRWSRTTSRSWQFLVQNREFHPWLLPVYSIGLSYQHTHMTSSLSLQLLMVMLMVCPDFLFLLTQGKASPLSLPPTLCQGWSVCQSQ